MKNNIKKYIPWIILVLLVASLGIWYFLSRRVSEEQLSQYESKIEEALDYEESATFFRKIIPQQAAGGDATR